MAKSNHDLATKAARPPLARRPRMVKIFFAPPPPLLDRSTAEVRRASRDVGQSPHDAVQQPMETARRCLCLDDCAQRGSAQRIRSALASRNAHRTESAWTNTPLSLTLPSARR